VRPSRAGARRAAAPLAGSGTIAGPVRSRPSAPNVFARIAAGKWFAAAVVVVILVNAVVLGLETYSRLNARYGHVLDLVNDVCLGLFVIELAIRIASYGRRPQDFFRSGWNVFDFVVILAGFTPGLGRDTTILRLVRLARVLRVVTVMPDLRILVVAVGRSMPAVASLGVLVLLLVYVYGIVGWLLFHEQIPSRWDDIGTAMLNLFVMLSLENLPDNLREGMAVYSWSWIYFVSYALMASFLMLNILIGVVINSLEEARAIEHRREREARMAARAAGDETAEARLALADAEDQAALIGDRLTALRDALEDLEDELRSADGRGRLPARNRASG
jgi:voltage-gated sodium channel